jgi:hypothetical protein
VKYICVSHYPCLNQGTVVVTMERLNRPLYGAMTCTRHALDSLWGVGNVFPAYLVMEILAVPA